jgi:hypothetical protein
LPSERDDGSYDGSKPEFVSAEKPDLRSGVAKALPRKQTDPDLGLIQPTALGILPDSAFFKIYLVVTPFGLKSTGGEAANSSTRWSSKGTSWPS